MATLIVCTLPTRNEAVSVCALSSPPRRIPLRIKEQLITSAPNVEIPVQPWEKRSEKNYLDDYGRFVFDHGYNGQLRGSLYRLPHTAGEPVRRQRSSPGIVRE